MGPMISLLVLLVSIARDVLRLRAEHADSLSVPKLSAEERARVDAAIAKAMQTKNTADLERFLKDGTVPAAEPANGDPKP